jgi:alpha-tubulin suppressor-like RCC1 family protein
LLFLTNISGGGNNIGSQYYGVFSYKPTLLSGISGKVISIACGDNVMAAATDGGAVYTWYEIITNVLTLEGVWPIVPWD